MPHGDRASTSNGSKLSAGLVTAMLVLSGATALVALVDPASAAHDDPADQDRLQFAHRPFANALDEKGIYANELDISTIGDGARPDVANSSLRVYGQAGQTPADTYLVRNSQDAPTDRDIDAPWRPDVIPKDSVTFNPAIIRHGDDDFTGFSGNFGWLTGCGADANLKKHLRLWYEPGRDYLGPRTDVISDNADTTVGKLDGESPLFDPPSKADTLVVETNYNVVDASSYKPVPMCEQDMIPFPVEGNFEFIADDRAGDACDCAVNLDTNPANYQPGLDTMQAVRVADIEADQDTDSDGDLDVLAKVRLERTIHLGLGDEVQLFDRVYQFRGTGEDPAGNSAALFRTWYAGNNFLDAPKDHAIVQSAHPNPDDPNWFFDRHSNKFDDAEHDVPKFLRTSYMRISLFQPDSNEVQISVGKEIQTGDVFYVDGVRHEIPLVSAKDPDGIPDTGDEEMTSLTIRTPLPKSAPDGSWTSVPNDQIEDRGREELVGPNGGKSWQVVDSSVVTTQWITQINITDPIPVNPPFNHETYSQVDDTDVQLWEQDEDNTQPNFPFGPKNPVNGLPEFPLGAEYLTRPEPTNCGTPPSTDVAKFCDWFLFYGEPGEDLDGKIDSMRTHNERLTQNRIGDTTGLNPAAWLTWIEHESTVLNFYPIKEFCDGRFSTSLHQVLEIESGQPDRFTQLEINSHPCQYTELVFPDRTNTVSETDLLTEGELDTNKPYPDAGIYRLLGGDYLLHSSLKLQDDVTRYAFTYDPQDNGIRGDINGLDQIDPYVNPVESEWADSTVRLYSKDLQALGPGQSADDFVPAFPYPDTEAGAEAPFDPNAIPGDSATFNPALIQHTAPDFTDEVGTFSWIQSCEGDAHLKKHLRVWYEKGHSYEGPRTEDPDGAGPASPAYDPPTQADVIQVESTYRMIDAASHEPVVMCAGQTQMPFPTEGTNADLPANAGETCGASTPLLLEGHNQPGLETMKQVDLARVFGGDTVHGGADVQRSVSLGVGDAVQMFDRILQYKGVGEDGVGNTVALFKTWYAGNTDPTKPNCINLVGADRVYMNSAGQSTVASSRPSSTQSSYLELQFFNDDMARITTGKEIHAGDTFYVDGVRYDVPAVRINGQDLDYITLRTPLPKSDPFPQVSSSDQVPCSSWTSVPEDQADQHKRETLQFGQCQVEDASVVSSQWLVNICPECPIPVDPPFNGYYTQIDDSDIQLWRQGKLNTEANFPFGEQNPDVPGGGDGQALFPNGHTYLTRQRVQCDPFPTSPQDAAFCEWIDHFDAEATNYQKLRNRIGATPEDPINPTFLWDEVGLPVDEGNFVYLQEWCEDRYNSILLQVLNDQGTAYTSINVDTEPCHYTEFVLPDRSNPASELLDVLLDTGLPGLPDVSDLLGGDYIISTSLKLEDEGHPAAQSTKPAFDPYDANENCEIETMPELINAIKDWLRPSGDPKKIPTFGGPPSLFGTAQNWLEGTYC